MNCGTRAGAVLIGCMLIAGCASQSTVTKDSGAAPAAAAKSEVSTPATVAPKATTPQTTIAAPPVATDTSTSAAAQAEQRQAELDAQSSLAAVYYAFDSSSLDSIARDTLQKDFKLLKGKTVKIEGHCDERGSDEYNMALGEKRAHAAQQYLVTLGVPADQISTVSYGKERPADTGQNESAWAKNRRAEIVPLK